MWNSRSGTAAAILAAIALSSGDMAYSDRAPATERQEESARAGGDTAKTIPAADFSFLDKRIREIQPTAKEGKNLMYQGAAALQILTLIPLVLIDRSAHQ